MLKVPDKMFKNVTFLILASVLIAIVHSEELICHAKLTDAASTWKTLFKESRASFIIPNQSVICMFIIIQGFLMIE